MNLHRLNRHTLLLGEHSYLDMSDECYFTDAYECRLREGVRSRILALKRGHEPAIVEMAAELAPLLPSEWTATYTFVPMPSSSGTFGGLVSMIKRTPASDVRDLVLQDGKTPPSHNGWRLTPKERQGILIVNELVVDPQPHGVVIVDDVLTTGSHFRAAKTTIRNRWKSIRVIGLFLARACSIAKSRCHDGISVCPAGFDLTIIRKKLGSGLL